MKYPSNEAALSLQTAADIAKACTTAGIADLTEISPLIAFARVAEEFSVALAEYQKAQQAWNRFVATHGSDDPGQDYYAEQLAAARAIYDVAHRAQAVALHTWRVARGLEAPIARAA